MPKKPEQEEEKTPAAWGSPEQDRADEANRRGEAQGRRIAALFLEAINGYPERGGPR
jgi:hypothetical protein